MKRSDRALPTVVGAIATAPIVLADGWVVGGGGGLDRLSAAFRSSSQDELRAILPKREDCTGRRQWRRQ